MIQAPQPKPPAFKLWLKFKPQFARTPSGTATLTNEIRQEGKREQVRQKTLRQMRKYIASGRIWKARVFEQPGNHTVEEWFEPFQS